jgi:hypothetical protein
MKTFNLAMRRDNNTGDRTYLLKVEDGSFFAFMARDVFDWVYDTFPAFIEHPRVIDLADNLLEKIYDNIKSDYIQLLDYQVNVFEEMYPEVFEVFNAKYR